MNLSEMSNVIEILDSEEEEVNSQDEEGSMVATETTDQPTEMENINVNNIMVVNKNKQRRKEAHQVINAPADIQFQTISNEQVRQKRRYRKRKDTHISSIEEALNATCDDFLKMKETEQKLRKIAIDRVRINYLLKKSGHAPIPLRLGSSLEDLNKQFLDHMEKQLNQ